MFKINQLFYSPVKSLSFSSVEQLESEIQNRDKVIKDLKKETIELKNKVAKMVEENSIILERREKSKWLESKVALATKKVYVKSINHGYLIRN